MLKKFGNQWVWFKYFFKLRQLYIITHSFVRRNLIFVLSLKTALQFNAKFSLQSLGNYLFKVFLIFTWSLFLRLWGLLRYQHRTLRIYTGACIYKVIYKLLLVNTKSVVNVLRARSCAWFFHKCSIYYQSL